MQRILEPGQIEAFAQRAIPRLRLPDRAHVFSMRAERLRKLSENERDRRLPAPDGNRRQRTAGSVAAFRRRCPAPSRLIMRTPMACRSCMPLRGRARNTGTRCLYSSAMQWRRCRIFPKACTPFVTG